MVAGARFQVLIGRLVTSLSGSKLFIYLSFQVLIGRLVTARARDVSLAVCWSFKSL